MRSLYVVLSILIAITFACDDDFILYGEWENITVVYGLLDPADSMQRIIISKTFQNPDISSDDAEFYDSVYYNTELNVQLFEYEIIDTLISAYDSSNWKRTNREPIVFKLESIDNYSIYFSEEKLKELNKYILEIEVPGKAEKVSAQTILIGKFKVTRPIDYQIGYNSPIYMESYVRPYTVTWESGKYGRMYELTMQFNYDEIYNGDTLGSAIQFKYPTNIVDEVKLPGDNRVTEMRQRVGGENFFEAVADSIAVDSLIKRKAKSFDFFFYIGDNDLFRYVSTYKNRKNVALYTNIHNGIGLLASKYTFIVPGKFVSDETKDSLAYGKYTKALNFSNFRGIWDDRP